MLCACRHIAFAISSNEVFIVELRIALQRDSS